MTTDCRVAWPAGCLGGLAAPQQALKRQRAKAEQASFRPPINSILSLERLKAGTSDQEPRCFDQQHRDDWVAAPLCSWRLYCCTARPSAEPVKVSGPCRQQAVSIAAALYRRDGRRRSGARPRRRRHSPRTRCSYWAAGAAVIRGWRPWRRRRRCRRRWPPARWCATAGRLLRRRWLR